MQMLANNTAVTIPPHVREQALLDVVDFVRADGLTLVGIFDTLGDKQAAHAAHELIGLCSDPLPDHNSIVGLLGDVHVALQSVSGSEMEKLVETGKVSFDILNAHRWTGARVEDLDRRVSAD